MVACLLGARDRQHDDEMALLQRAHLEEMADKAALTLTLTLTPTLTSQQHLPPNTYPYLTLTMQRDDLEEMDDKADD